MLRALVLAGALLLVIGTGWLAGTVGANIAADAARARIDTEARLRAALFESEIGRYRLLPLLLTNDTDFLGAVDGNSDARRALNAKFARLAGDTGAEAIYLLAPSGIAISASNADTPTSFVGNAYSFRAYYRAAKETGSGLEYAMGTVSGRPGLYLSQETPNGGIVVVKLAFNGIEREWAQGGGVTMVEDPAGTVLVTSIPGLRFRDDEGEGVDRGRSPLLPSQQIRAAVPTSIQGWRLIHSEPRTTALGAMVPHRSLRRGPGGAVTAGSWLDRRGAAAAAAGKGTITARPHGGTGSGRRGTHTRVAQ